MRIVPNEENPQSNDEIDFDAVDTGAAGQATPVDPVDKAAAALAEQLVREKDLRKEERFIWIVVCTILIDIIWLRSSNNASLSIVILVLEFTILLIIARNLGINEIAEFINKSTNRILGNESGK